MTIALSDTLRDARLQALADAMAGGTLTLYTATQPATGAAITTQTALVTVAIPSGLTVSSHLLTLSLAVTTITAGGEAAWGRIKNSSADFVMDGTCGLVASSADFRLTTTALSVSGTLIPIIATFAEA